MLKTDTNGGSLSIEVFDGIRASVFMHRSQFSKDLTVPFSRCQPTAPKFADSGSRAYSLISRTSSIVRGFSETDFNTDLRKGDMPTLIYTKTTTRSRADWCVGSGLREVHRPVVRTWARP